MFASISSSLEATSKILYSKPSEQEKEKEESSCQLVFVVTSGVESLISR